MARKMKDSGIEWIGEIPEGWEVTKIKHIVSSVTDIDHFMPDSVESGIPYLMIGNLKDLSSSIDWDSSKKISIEDYKKLSIKSRPQKGDIIFARYASIGITCYIDTDRDFLVSYACLTIHPSDLIIGKFLSYYLKSSSFAEDVLRRTNSNTQGNVGKDSLVNATIVLPSIIEQTQIVNFLEAKCSDINAMLSKTRSSIEEYKKLKHAVITQAVATQQCSHIKLKYLMNVIVDCPHETPTYSFTGNYYVIRTADQALASLRCDEDMYRLDASEYKKRTRRLTLDKDDIVYGREGERWGLACIVPESNKYCLGQRIMQFRCNTKFLYPKYAMYALNSEPVYLQGVADTIGSTSPHVNISTVCNYLLPVPALTEQKEIANYLDAKCAEIDRLIAKKEQLVKELESYKKSLIYEVVTGKREV